MNIKIDDRELKRWLLFAEKQLPYAHALALSTLAWKARDDLRDEAERSLTIRRGFPMRGIVSTRADKRNLSRGAVVGSRDEMMAVLAIGGDRPKTAPIPMIADRGSGGAGYPRATMKTAVARANWFSRAKKKATKKARRFIGEINGMKGLWQSTKEKGGSSLKLLYKIQDRPAHIEKRWEFYRTVERSVERNWPRVAEASAMKALDTRKAKR